MYDTTEITPNQFIAKEEILPFQRIVPYPKEYADKDQIVKEMGHAKAFELGISDGFNSGGYSWCVGNWGTKWLAGNGSGEIQFRGKGNTRAVVNLEFVTAWSPPKPIILALSNQFPSISFSLKYYEGGMGFKGVFSAKNGETLDDHSSDYRGNRGG